MKKNKQYIWIALSIIITVGFWSCSQMPISDNNIDDSPSLNIKVSDKGYAKFDNGQKQQCIGTEEEDVGTKFTEKDQIGIFGVKDRQIAEGINNLHLTAEKNGNDIIWQTDSKKPLKLTAGMTYYAYYPYQSNLKKELLHPEKTTADEFFADIVKGWNTDDDQGDHDKYTKNDLMIAQSTPIKKVLSFEMTHTMALVKIDFLSHTHYIFSNKIEDSIAPISDYSVDAPPPPIFDKIVPWHTHDYSYRYLVNPNKSAESITGSYSGAIFKWKCNLSTIKPGFYQIYKVGGDHNNEIVPIKVVLNLEPGDYYLKDGNLLKKDFKLDDAFKTAVRGIVFKAGKNTKGFYLDECKYKKKDGEADLNQIHGYVEALYEGGDHENLIDNIYFWGAQIIINCSTSINGFYGYSDTQKIKQACATNPTLTHNLETDFTATYWANIGYDSSYKIQEGDQKAPDNSSGWFLPSIGQLHCMYAQKPVLENSAKKAGGQGWDWDEGSTRFYWSSSELKDLPEYGALAIDMKDGSISPGGFYKHRQTYYYIRPILVF